MKALKKISLGLALVACITAPTVSVSAHAASPTGYTRAEDVEYVTQQGYVVNWGAREEDCLFLSEYAEAFYEGNYAYDILSENAGGSSQSDAPKSALYASLRDMMKAKHKKITNYQETRPMYRYTDCERNDYSTISSFYSGKSLNGTWDSGATWNREHTWPNSKGLGGSDENDIMMLRPTSVSENSSRGNKAYGESGGYFNPGESVKGDCARIALYVYTRWENTSYMWGTGGVIENLTVLLKWMEEDPVDTWEMGRNDAVQSITGTRNVFVDYPEYAWLLFGKEMPQDMPTPSGVAKNGATGPEQPTPPVEEEPEQPTPPAEPENPIPPSSEECQHAYGEWFVIAEATETMDGERWRICQYCKEYDKEILPKTGTEHENGANLSGLLNCNSTVISPFSVTVFLAGVYLFAGKRHGQG